MKTMTGTSAGVLPRRIAAIFGLAEGTGVSGHGRRARDPRSPLAEPDSPHGVRTV